jgi:pyruvate-ferredoxin/flavodoxin oxidoreductase
MSRGLNQQKLAVQTGYWPLYRYNPALSTDGKAPLTLDSKEPTLPLEEFAYNETRYRMLMQSNEARADTLMQLAKHDVSARWQEYQHMSESQKDLHRKEESSK